MMILPDVARDRAREAINDMLEEMRENEPDISDENRQGELLLRCIMMLQETGKLAR